MPLILEHFRKYESVQLSNCTMIAQGHNLTLSSVIRLHVFLRKRVGFNIEYV